MDFQGEFLLTRSYLKMFQYFTGIRGSLERLSIWKGYRWSGIGDRWWV